MIADRMIFSIDIALRGASAVLLLLLAALLMRDHGRTWAARLGALFAVGAAAYAFSSAAGFRPGESWWRVALTAFSEGNNLVFWLFARALFDDDFRPRAWHAVLWASLVGATLFCGLALWPLHSPLAAPVDAALALEALAFAALGVLQTLASWPADLIERRRRLRVDVVAVSAGYTGLIALANLLGLRHAAPQAVSLAGAAGLAVISIFVAWRFLGVAGGGALFLARNPLAQIARPVDLSRADRQILAQIERAMSVERVYRRDGLTIGALAAMNNIPEHRLRRLVNQGLGRRNFNSFLNSYRVADARAGLADPTQAEVPILTIALDAGFSSLGPFNRAFKLETGMTPSEYRRQALHWTAGEQPIPVLASRIPKSA
jgi:AraC-like DNA-binding protein